MAVYRHLCTVAAPLAAVAALHSGSHALQWLTPPPIWVQFHRLDPLQNGSISEFTLWFGPLPIRWRAEHSGVTLPTEFTDTQTAGPMRFWQHTHRFTAVSPTHTQIEDVVEYEHFADARRWLTQLLFARPLLRFMFLYREAIIGRLLAAPLPKV